MSFGYSRDLLYNRIKSGWNERKLHHPILSQRISYCEYFTPACTERVLLQTVYSYTPRNSMDEMSENFLWSKERVLFPVARTKRWKKLGKKKKAKSSANFLPPAASLFRENEQIFAKQKNITSSRWRVRIFSEKLCTSQKKKNEKKKF